MFLYFQHVWNCCITQLTLMKHDFGEERYNLWLRITNKKVYILSTTHPLETWLWWQIKICEGKTKVWKSRLGNYSIASKERSKETYDLGLRITHQKIYLSTTHPAETWLWWRRRERSRVMRGRWGWPSVDTDTGKNSQSSQGLTFYSQSRRLPHGHCSHIEGSDASCAR